MKISEDEPNGSSRIMGTPWLLETEDQPVLCVSWELPRGTWLAPPPTAGNGILDQVDTCALIGTAVLALTWAFCSPLPLN